MTENRFYFYFLNESKCNDFLEKIGKIEIDDVSIKNLLNKKEMSELLLKVTRYWNKKVDKKERLLYVNNMEWIFFDMTLWIENESNNFEENNNIYEDINFENQFFNEKLKEKEMLNRVYLFYKQILKYPIQIY